MDCHWFVGALLVTLGVGAGCLPAHPLSNEVEVPETQPAFQPYDFKTIWNLSSSEGGRQNILTEFDRLIKAESKEPAMGHIMTVCQVMCAYCHRLPRPVTQYVDDERNHVKAERPEAVEELDFMPDFDQPHSLYEKCHISCFLYREIPMRHRPHQLYDFAERCHLCFEDERQC